MNGVMATSILDNIKKGPNKVKEYIEIMMVHYILAVGKMVNNMVKEHLEQNKMILNKAFGMKDKMYAFLTILKKN